MGFEGLEGGFYDVFATSTTEGLIRDGGTILGLGSTIVQLSKGDRWKRIPHHVLFTKDTKCPGAHTDGIEMILWVLSRSDWFISDSAARDARRRTHGHRALMTGRRLQDA